MGYSYGMQVVVKDFLNTRNTRKGLGLLISLELILESLPVEVMIVLSKYGALMRYPLSLFLNHMSPL